MKERYNMAFIKTLIEAKRLKRVLDLGRAGSISGPRNASRMARLRKFEIRSARLPKHIPRRICPTIQIALNTPSEELNR